MFLLLSNPKDLNMLFSLSIFFIWDLLIRERFRSENKNEDEKKFFFLITLPMRGCQWGGTIVVGRSLPIWSCGIDDGNSNDNATIAMIGQKNLDVNSPNLRFWWQLDLRLEHLLRYLRALPTICVHPELDGRTLDIFHSLIFFQLPLSFLKLLNFEEKRSSSRERDLQGQVFFLFFFSRKYVSNSSKITKTSSSSSLKVLRDPG